MTQAMMDAIFNSNSLTLVLMIGGFLWLAKNHLAHIQISLNDLRKDVDELKEDVAFIKGRCLFQPGEEGDE